MHHIHPLGAGNCSATHKDHEQPDFVAERFWTVPLGISSFWPDAMTSERHSGFTGRKVDETEVAPAFAPSFPGFDAYGSPAIIFGGNSQLVLEMRAVLQSLGFDVLSGIKDLGTDEEPVVLIIRGPEEMQNRQKVDQVMTIWPQAPVVTVNSPVEAVTQMMRVFL